MPGGGILRFMSYAAIQSFSLRFLRASEGVTAVEFAFVAPVLILFMLGIIETALIMLAYNVMEGATNLSSRTGATGFVVAGQSREATIRAALDARAGSLLDTSQMTVTAKFYNQYDQINDPEPYVDTNDNGVRDAGEAYTDVNGNGQWDVDMGQAGYGGAGAIVVYTVSYPWNVITPIMRELIGTNGILTLTTHAVAKNEPF